MDTNSHDLPSRPYFASTATLILRAGVTRFRVKPGEQVPDEALDELDEDAVRAMFDDGRLALRGAVHDRPPVVQVEEAEPDDEDLVPKSRTVVVSRQRRRLGSGYSEADGRMRDVVTGLRRGGDRAMPDAARANRDGLRATH